jgi:hypothetical protein
MFKKPLIYLLLLLTLAGSALFAANSTVKNAVYNFVNAQVAGGYDVVVAGAGTGGIGAAVQAGRMGARVLLLEETDYIGGQAAAAGVSTIDVGTETYNEGLYREFENKIRAFYKSRNVPTWWPYCVTSSCFGPKEIRDILTGMINNVGGITLKTRTKVTSVQKSGSQITGVTLSSGESISTKVLIDATEYGDVIPLTGASYRVGNDLLRGVSASPGANVCIQDITYTAVIKKYPNDIVPENLKFTSPPPGYSENIVRFAGVVTDTATDAQRYPTSWDVHNRYRGMANPGLYIPNTVTKTGINWANDFPGGGGLMQAKYLTDKNYRKQINCEAKLRTIQFLYYVQQSAKMRGWAISTDEGYDTPYNRAENDCGSLIPPELKTIEHNLPVMPYVRESIRGVGLHTLTAREIKRPNFKPFNSTIGVGTYPTDLHNCNAGGSLESEFESADDATYHSGGPFEVPLESLISSEVDGLIFAEKNLSQSRLTNGATRLQPSTMNIGQAAGALAALAARNDISPKSVPVLQVQQKVLDADGVIRPFSDVYFYKDVSPPGAREFWHDANAKYIQEMSVRGITAGTSQNTFAPTGNLLRDQVAIFLVKSFNLPVAASYQGIFADVASSNPFALFIEALYRNGVASGCSANPLNFCPGGQITNAQLAVFGLNGWRKKDAVGDLTATQTYSDVPRSHWAFNHIETLAEKGVKWFCNTGTRGFCPDAPATRGASAYVLVSILRQLDPWTNPNIRTASPAPTPIRTPPPTPVPTRSPTVRPSGTGTALNRGDINRDGNVNILDIGILIDNYNRTVFTNPRADINTDGIVNILDVGIVIDNYNR